MPTRFRRAGLDAGPLRKESHQPGNRETTRLRGPGHDADSLSFLKYFCLDLEARKRTGDCVGGGLRPSNRNIDTL